MQRYEHIKVLFFHSSLPSIVMRVMVLRHSDVLYTTIGTCVVFHGLLYISKCVCWYRWKYLLLSGACTVADTNTIDTTWNHVKVYFSAYNWKVQFIFYLAQYMFGAYVRLVLSPRLHHVHSHCEMCSVVRSLCASSCWHSTSPCVCEATPDNC
jgi:hypothetical protein